MSSLVCCTTGKFLSDHRRYLAIIAYLVNHCRIFLISRRTDLTAIIVRNHCTVLIMFLVSFIFLYMHFCIHFNNRTMCTNRTYYTHISSYLCFIVTYFMTFLQMSDRQIDIFCLVYHSHLVTDVMPRE